MADVKWVKLAVDLPDNRKIKRIRKLPDGDKVILFWVFLIARAGEANQGGALFFTDSVPYTEEELAADFDFSIEFVRFAMITLEKYRMIERFEEIIFIKNWDEYQQMDKLEKIQEQNRIRQARYREKQQKIANNNVSITLPVTESNAVELELEQELEQEEIEKIPYTHIINYLNEKSGKSFKSVESNKKFIRARWNEGNQLEDFQKVIDIKTAQWIDDKEMNKYLRPSTLFGGKFDNYLNEWQPEKQSGKKIDDSWQQQMEEMME